MSASTASLTQRDVYSVARLNREARALLEGGFALLWVEAEISNLARPGSGHLYFSLKDAEAQVRCAMFRNRNQHLGFTPDNGMQVLARVRVSLYEARGEFQLLVEHMEEAGDGALRRAFEALKQRLDKEGLFDPARKRPLPILPRAIGVVTSPTGAAVRDILTVLQRRFPAIPVFVYPVPVQGEGTAARIAAAIGLASKRKDCDVLIVGRGGGSLEDLWAFNEEPVARAIFTSEIPVVSAVGHEIDFTIADFVADVRAPTPSAAAELLSPDRAEWLEQLRARAARFFNLAEQMLSHRQQNVTWLHKRLQQQHPGTRLRQRAQRVDELDLRLRLGLRAQMRHVRANFAELTARLHRHVPTQRLEHLQSRTSHAMQRLQTAMQARTDEATHKLAVLRRALDAVSPLRTLERGYAIVTAAGDGGVIRDSKQAKPGDRVQAQLAHGRLQCVVERSDKGDK